MAERDKLVAWSNCAECGASAMRKMAHSPGCSAAVTERMASCGKCRKPFQRRVIIQQYCKASCRVAASRARNYRKVKPAKPHKPRWSSQTRSVFENLFGF